MTYDMLDFLCFLKKNESKTQGAKRAASGEQSEQRANLVMLVGGRRRRSREVGNFGGLYTCGKPAGPATTKLKICKAPR